MSDMKQYVNEILDLVSKRDPDQKQFKNTVAEVLTSVVPLLENIRNTKHIRSWSV